MLSQDDSRAIQLERERGLIIEKNDIRTAKIGLTPGFLSTVDVALYSYISAIYIYGLNLMIYTCTNHIYIHIA